MCGTTAFIVRKVLVTLSLEAIGALYDDQDKSRIASSSFNPL
jgi:hypothetical protein